MNLIVKYIIKNVDASAQLVGGTGALGVHGVNFIGANPDASLALASPAVDDGEHQGHHKGVVLPAVDSVSGGTYVDKIISIQLPTLDATTATFLSVGLDKIGVHNDIIGVELLGLTKAENDNTAAFFNGRLLEQLIFSVSKNRLLIKIDVLGNAIGASTMNLRITYKN